ncbi:MAG TPA: hypothetical protein VLF39_01425 [Candidatus Saccharimonadales bacterium]|nr:hypothetical protein [Candidatus Saccharimonadales bacterium]
MVGEAGLISPDLEAARAQMNAAEDRLDEAYARRLEAGGFISQILARNEVRSAGRDVNDSGEHLGMLEELARLTAEEQ